MQGPTDEDFEPADPTLAAPDEVPSSLVLQAPRPFSVRGRATSAAIAFLARAFALEGRWPRRKAPWVRKHLPGGLARKRARHARVRRRMARESRRRNRA